MTQEFDKTMSRDRYGEAYVNMNCFVWDPIFGKPPKGWGKMTDRERFECELYRKNFAMLLDILTPKEQSMYWWTLKLGRPYEVWEAWWNSKQQLKEMKYDEQN